MCNGLFFSLGIFTSIAVAKSANDIQFISAPVSNFTRIESEKGNLQWVAWADDLSAEKVAHLVLHQRQGGELQAVWSESWPNVYALELRSMHQWRWLGHDLLAVTLQYTPTSEQVELYGIDSDNHPVLLAQKKAAIVSWRLDKTDKLILVVSDAIHKTNCYGWLEKSHQLVTQGCTVR
jgi:hypothetical protein